MEQTIPFSSPLPNIAQKDMAQGATMQNPADTKYAALFKAVRSGDFLKDHPEAVSARITSEGARALHIAIMFEHLHIVEELVESMSPEDLKLLTDQDGITVLHCAVMIKTTKKAFKAVKYLVEKDTSLVTIPDHDGWVPITMALEYGNPEMARYLYPLTPSQALLLGNGQIGAQFLNQCYKSKMIDIALDLIKKCPRLIVMEGPKVPNFWHTLAAIPSEIPSWHEWNQVGREQAFAMKDIVVDVPETTERTDDDSVTMTVRDKIHGGGSLLFCQLGRTILCCIGIKIYEARLFNQKKVHEARLAYKQYLELLHAACDFISTLNEEEMKRGKIAEALLVAAQRGNPDFIVEAVKVKFYFLWTRDEREKGIFHLAIESRQESVFNLIHGLALKNIVVNYIDKKGNSLLHMAGLLAPATYLNHISGALLQMQRELQWFKAVERIMPPLKKESVNEANFTGRELFTEKHKALVKEGEEWTKATANSCSVVAALVATITFAAAFTVPGGNDQNNGYPIFLQRKLFLVFAISDAVSLFSSSTSLLMFLGLLTSRYAEDDFLTNLPTKLIIGLSTMFISIATMMVAFCGLFLMIQNQYSWIVIPVTVLASVPVTLYILLQFPLLVKIFWSTYFAGILPISVEPWP